MSPKPPPYAEGSELPPGTSYLVDQAGISDSKHDRKHADIVLVPMPSKDPNDPLNWSTTRKTTQLMGLVVYTLTVGFSSASIYSVLVPIAADSGITVTQLNNGTGYMFLLFGWGCLFWQALAVAFGKRPVYLLSILLTIAVQVWGAYIDTNSMWILNKVLQGFVGAPIESLIEVSISDVYFSHERGTYLGVYTLCLFLSNFIAPVFAGLMNADQGWQWVLKWGGIINAIGFVICFLTLEETNYRRVASHESVDSSKETTTASVTQSIDGKEKEKDAEEGASRTVEVQGYSFPDTTTPVISSFTKRMFSLPRPMPHAWALFVKQFYTPVLLLSMPIISFCGFQYGINLVWFNVLNATASSILSSAPYNFGSIAVGLTYLSPSVGSAISTLATGYITDKIKIYMARRNHGYSEPEHRLWLFPVGMILSPLALLCWGVGAYFELPWGFIVVMGMGVLACSLGLGTGLAITYAIDCYKDLEPTGHAEELTFDAIPCVMTTVILVRNTMSFAIGYGINPWITGMGLRDCFIMIAVIAWAACVSWLIFIKFGKKMRIGGKERYLKLIS